MLLLFVLLHSELVSLLHATLVTNYIWFQMNLFVLLQSLDCQKLLATGGTDIILLPFMVFFDVIFQTFCCLECSATFLGLFTTEVLLLISFLKN